MLLVNYLSSISNVRVLENDNVTIRGVSKGLFTYESRPKTNIILPFVSVDMININ